MKILITYASAGAGHFKAAQAAYNYLKPLYPEGEVVLVDILDYSAKIFKSVYKGGYSFAVKYAPWLWAVSFWLTNVKLINPLIKWMALGIDLLFNRRFTKLLRDSEPDLIISAHFLSSSLAAFLKRKGKIKSKLFTVITDFGVHAYWIQMGTDFYFTASKLTSKELLDAGIRSEIIIESGIPADAKFLKHFDRSKLKDKFGIAADKFCLLIVTGSFGIGPIEEIVLSLHNDLQVIVVCASNKKLYSQLSAKNYPGVKVLGFVDNIEELMAVSDILVTKPGGMTITEALLMELPPLFICAIPGQEMKNIEALAKFGIGTRIENTAMLKGVVLDYKAHPEKLNSIKEQIRLIRKPLALEEIHNVIRKSSTG